MVKLVRDRGVTVAQAVRELDVDKDVLRQWSGNMATILASPFLEKVK
ncbi:hypothetical protein [Oryzicola mucosus]